MKHNFDNLIKSIGQINQLQQVAVETTLLICKQEVNDILRLNIKDIKQIERVLDMLLEVAFDEQILELFRKLCRHYYLIDPQATVFYIQSYREMWDSEITETVRQADVYVFCLLQHKDQETIDPLNLDQWEFYVLATETLDVKLGSQKTITLSSLRQLNPITVQYEGLSAAIKQAANQNNEPT